VDNYVIQAVLAAVRGAPDPRAVDFVQDIALPVTTSTTVSLLGLPPDVVTPITEASAAIVRSMMHGLIPGGDHVGIAERALVSQIIDEALGRADGGLLGMIRGDPDHGTVDRQALVNSIRVVVLAGINSTQRTLSLAMNSLLTAHGTLQRFAAAADKVRAVNELVRYDGSAQSAARFCTRPITFHGCSFTEGASVIALLGSANRDERRFPDPDDIVLDRHPNPHLGFGRGEHACLGIPVAQQISIAVLGYFSAHYPHVALGHEQEPVIEPNPALRGFLSFQLALW
jgi:cytochrome P450